MQLVRASSVAPGLAARALLTEHAEDVMLGALLLVALLVRVIGLNSLEPNILPDEADNLRVSYHLLAGTGPGPFELSWDGNPVASLYPALMFLDLLGPSYVVLRFSSAVASILALVVFFALARRALSYFASLGATTLLAFSIWYLFFSRNGEINIWVLLYTLAAAYFTQRAIDSGRWRFWVAAGLFCGLGFYGYLAGVLILPVMLLYLFVLALLDRSFRKNAALGGAVLVILTALLILPRVPVLIERRAVVEGHVIQRSILKDTNPADVPKILGDQIMLCLRAFVLLEPNLTGNPRYIPPGTPVLDSMTGTLYFVGLFLSVRHLRETALWWCLFAPFIIVSQTFLRGVPDGGRALPGLPAMLLFGGLTIDWLIQRPALGNLSRFALTLAIPAVALWNWTHYVDWQRLPSNAQVRQPAVEVAEFPIWQELQLTAAATGQRGFTVMEWIQERDRYRPAAAAPNASSLRMATAVEVHPVVDFNPTAPLKKPRGVAADASGQALVLDDDGQIVKLDQSGKSVSTFGSGTGGPHSDEPSDLAIARDGSFLVLDAGRGQIDRYEASGRFLGSLGADWGMYRPRGLAVGASGKVYVADTGHNRVIVAADLKIEKELKDLDQPTDVEVDPRGWMYVVQPEVSKLAVFDQDGKQQATWDVSRSNTVEGPHLAFLESGALAVTDPARRLVVILDLNGRELELIGGNEPIFSQPYAVGSAGGRLLVTDSARPGVKAFEVLSR